MAAVAGAGAGGGDQMLRPRPRPRRQRLPLSDLTNLSVVTRLLKPRAKPRTSPASSVSSIGSSTVPRIPTPPPPAALSVSVSVSAAKGKDKVTRELQTSTTHLNKIQRISKPKVKSGGVLPGPSSPPSKNTRKTTRKEQSHTEPLISPLFASSKAKMKTGGNVLPDVSTLASKKTMKVTREKQPCMEPLISALYSSSKTKTRTGGGLSGASSPASKKTRKVTGGEEEQADGMELLEETSCDEEPPVPMQGFIEERRAYFAEVDALSWWRSLFRLAAMQSRGRVVDSDGGSNSSKQ